MSTPPDPVVLTGSERVPAVGARRAGPADVRGEIAVTLVLRRGTEPLPRSGAARSRSSRTPRYLTRAEFAARHGARPADREAVRSFAAAAGLHVLEDRPECRTVRLAGRGGDVASAFGTRLFRYLYPGGSYRGREGPIRLPRSLDGIVVGVLGLDDRPQARPHVRPRPPRAAAAPSYSPPQVAAAYDFPSGTTGVGECIGFVELGGGYRADDLTTYFAGLGVPSPSVTAVGVDGASNAPTGVPSGPDGEVELDLEVAGAISPGAALVAYFAPNTDAGFLDAVMSAVHDTAHGPSIVSISWGSPEETWTAQARAALESAFEDAASLGVTVLAAAGDQGATDGSAHGALEVDFPASAPGAVGCGGTTLTLSGVAIASETVWNELARNEGATGGGVSELFALPSFQSAAGVPAAPNGFTGRGVPDVAGDADPATGYAVRIDGSATVLGGTSAVAPLWAALLARLNQSLGRPVGDVLPALYSAPAGTFRDITSGGNDGYNAGPGWDPCTGLGSPNGAALLRALGGT
jgi:kumamolisin